MDTSIDRRANEPGWLLLGGPRACTQQRNKKRRFAAEIVSAVTAEAVSGPGESRAPKRGPQRTSGDAPPARDFARVARAGD